MFDANVAIPEKALPIPDTTFRTTRIAVENVPLTIRGICEKTFKICPGNETKKRTIPETSVGTDCAMENIVETVVPARVEKIPTAPRITDENKEKI